MSPIRRFTLMRSFPSAYVPALLLTVNSCTETPLDATLLEETPTPLPPSEPLDSGVPLCPTDALSSGSYRLLSKETGACLEAGSETPIEPALIATGYTLEFTRCGESEDQLWGLMPDAFGWQIYNLERLSNVDVEGSSIANGTEVLLYEPHELLNQRFMFEPMLDNDFRIRPLHTANSCLEDMGTYDDLVLNAVEMWGCDAAPTQLWQISPSECAGD